MSHNILYALLDLSEKGRSHFESVVADAFGLNVVFMLGIDRTEGLNGIAVGIYEQEVLSRSGAPHAQF